MTNEDELLDLVDKNDNVIGTIWRSQTNNLHNENRGYLRSIEVLLFNNIGELWIPTRNLNKRIAPGGLDYSTGGHVGAGESYIEACIREVKEELNLEIKPESLQLLHKFPPVEGELTYIRTVYLYKTDKTPNYNKEDFTSYEWLTPKELLKKLESGTKAKRSLLATIKYLIKHQA